MIDKENRTKRALSDDLLRKSTLEIAKEIAKKRTFSMNESDQKPINMISQGRMPSVCLEKENAPETTT